MATTSKSSSPSLVAAGDGTLLIYVCLGVLVSLHHVCVLSSGNTKTMETISAPVSRSCGRPSFYCPPVDGRIVNQQTQRNIADFPVTAYSSC